MAPPIILLAAAGNVVSRGFLAIPVQDPDGANLLLSTTGIALIDGDGLSADLLSTSFYVDTAYKLLDSDIPIKQPIAFAALASVTADDNAATDSVFTFSIDQVSAFVASGQNIGLNLALSTRGDCGILRVSFQIYALITRK